MKIIGRILMLIASICFILNFIFFCIGLPKSIELVNGYTETSEKIVGWVVLVAIGIIQIVYLFGALGGISFFCGWKIFRKHAGRLAIILLIVWIIYMIPHTINVVRQTISVQDYFINILPCSLASVFFVVGYFLGRGKIE